MPGKWKLREPFCSGSHLLGAVLSVVALIVLVCLADGRIPHLIGFTLYGASLVALYTASGLYHGVFPAPHAPRRLQRLQRFDHSAIFLLIAGTYAPLCLVTLRGPWGWGLFAAEYTLALVGIVASVGQKRLPDIARITLYLVMGWLVVAVTPPLRAALPPAGLALLVGGGLTYCAGVVVFATDRPHLWPGRFSAHDLWHVFVMAGSVCHFLLMLFFIVPAP